MILPKEKFQYHPIILDLAFRAWARRKFEGFPPDLSEISMLNLDYYDEVLLYGDIVEYVRDESKRIERGMS